MGTFIVICVIAFGLFLLWGLIYEHVLPAESLAPAAPPPPPAPTPAELISQAQAAAQWQVEQAQAEAEARVAAVDDETQADADEYNDAFARVSAASEATIARIQASWGDGWE